MAARAFIADGLWQCLCPAYPRFSATRPRIPSRKRILSFYRVTFSTASDDDSRIHNEKPSQSQHLVFRRIGSDYSSPRTTGTYHGIAPKWYFPPKHTPLVQKRLLLEIIPKDDSADVPALYELLAKEAARSDPGLVWYIVEHLVVTCREKPNRQLYSAMIRACSSATRGGAAMLAEIITEMQDEGIELDEEICHYVLEVLSVHPDYNLLTLMLEHMDSKWYVLSEFGQHSVIASLIKDRQFELAMDRMEAMVDGGTPVEPWLHDMLYYIMAECTPNNITEALHILQLRENSSTYPISANMWQHLLDSASSQSHYDAVKYVWRKRVEPAYMVPPTGICLNVLMTASRAGDVELATDVFRLLSARNVVLDRSHYELLIDAYLAAHDLETALSVLSIMTDAHVYIDASCTRTLYRYLISNSARPNQAIDCLRRIQLRGAPIPVPAMDVIIEATVQLNRFEDAMHFWSLLPDICTGGKPETSTINILLRGCVRNTRREIATYLAQYMIDNGLQPNLLTYDRLVLVHLHSPDTWDAAFSYFDEMLSRDWEPRPGTWRFLVRKTAEAGDPRCRWAIEQMIARNAVFDPQTVGAIAAAFPGKDDQRTWLKPVFRRERNSRVGEDSGGNWLDRSFELV
ncbi:hypothetical protein EJ05DRAFT_497097 [Pseudovirgaria hyperparasitica]|uniref:Pentatricopeptide repeat-containing protein-mitochondrial domain-containing protein n=1 Tax=Pseudovirgaria hyperparasitica TaxID=470096 RepID=A0A6A6WJV8_9PEZI|nr:uncharacterized protein EJ05DRAFT_497097 [Pseudovirgaria hyperparasitica]KAF2762237.1 hypothetical protein EJ05DRAFT_497097 [Pseudovirgaria hyperparasitica]